MSLELKRLLLQVYGLGRLVFGAWLLVGLSAGYFLSTGMVRYPPQVITFLLDRDLIAMTYFAFFFGGIFHLISGGVIARLSVASRLWLYFGWPILVIIQFGLLYVYYEAWAQQSYVASFSSIINWPQLILSFVIIVFDLFFVIPTVEILNVNYKEKIEDLGLAYGRIFLTLFLAIFVLSVILYLGKPIKKGFHKGFYKVNGEYDPNRLDQVQKIIPTETSEPEPVISEVVKEKEPEETAAPIQTMTLPAVKVDEAKAQVLTSKTKQEAIAQEGLSYIQILGWIGAVSIILGCVFSFLNQPQIYSLLTGLGFLCWIVYGMSLGLWPLVLAGICVFVFSVMQIFQK